MVALADLRALAEIEAAETVSIYMPAEVATPQGRQNAIRLKNLLDEAVDKLVADDYRRPDAENLLQPARDLLPDGDFWEHQAPGLAVFAAPGFFRYDRLPIRVEQQVIVSPRLHLRPLLPLFAEQGRFMLLALSARRARLFEGSRYGLEPIEADLPAGVGEITAETDYENTRHAPPPARPRSPGPVGMPATHNFGEDPEEQRKAQLVEYLRRVADAVEPLWADRKPPLVLAGQDEVRGHMRAVGKSLAFVEPELDLNPDALDERELHDRAYALVRPRFDEGRRADLGRFMSLYGTADKRASTVPAEIVEAARFGRVETLFVVDHARLWGHVEGDSERQVVAHGTPRPEDEDLLDLAASQTLLQGGRVEVVAQEELPPVGVLMAAIFRY